MSQAHPGWRGVLNWPCFAQIARKGPHWSPEPCPALTSSVPPPDPTLKHSLVTFHFIVSNSVQSRVLDNITRGQKMMKYLEMGSVLMFSFAPRDHIRKQTR